MYFMKVTFLSTIWQSLKWTKIQCFALNGNFSILFVAFWSFEALLSLLDLSLLVFFFWMVTTSMICTSSISVRGYFTYCFMFPCSCYSFLLLFLYSFWGTFVISYIINEFLIFYWPKKYIRCSHHFGGMVLQANQSYTIFFKSEML